MGLKLPLVQQYWLRDWQGYACYVDVLIEQTGDIEKFPPEGIKCVFKAFREYEDKLELILLIDNHKPLGFHVHDKLPGKHDSRRILNVSHWQSAWAIFNKKLKEILSET